MQPTARTAATWTREKIRTRVATSGMVGGAGAVCPRRTLEARSVAMVQEVVEGDAHDTARKMSAYAARNQARYKQRLHRRVKNANARRMAQVEYT